MVDVQGSILIGILLLFIYFVWYRKNPFIGSILFIASGLLILFFSLPDTLGIAIGVIITLTFFANLLRVLTQPIGGTQ